MMSKKRENYERVAYSLLLVTPEVLEKYIKRRYPSGIMTFKEPFKEKLPTDQWKQVEELIGRYGLHLFYHQINNTVLDKTVLDNLISKGVMSIEDRKKVRGKKSQSEKNRTFLDILITKPGDNYNDFIEAVTISKENLHIVNQLDSTEPQIAERRTEMKIKVQKNYAKLVTDFDFSVILDTLYEKEVLNDDEKEKISKYMCKSDRNRYVLEIVMQKSECEKFLNALGDDPAYSELVNTIKATKVTEAEIRKAIKEGQQHGDGIDVSTMINIASVLFKSEIPTAIPKIADISFGADFYRLKSFMKDIINKDEINDEIMSTVYSEITEILARLDGPEIKDVLENNFEKKKQESMDTLKKLKENLDKEISDLLTKDMVDVTVTEGHDANFEIWTKENIKCTKWFKNEIEIANSKRYEIHNSGTIHSLKIRTTDLSDKAVYTVRLQGAERRARLEVIEYFTKSPLNIIECNEGDNVELSYEVLEEKAAVVWKKFGYEINNITKYDIKDHGKTHTLYIKKTELEDEGNYLVQVNGRQRVTNLKVKAYFSKDLEDKKECFEGDNVIFECEILDEDMIAQWSKDGVVFRTLDRYKIQKQGRHHQLHVINTSLKDTGEYCVLIKNCRRKCILRVREKPKRALCEQEKSLYLDTITSANETRFYIRIIIIGESGVGKTCLLRRLLKVGIEEVKSTDGIDIQRCKIRKNDGTWIYDKVTDKRKELIARLKRSIINQTVLKPSNNNFNKTQLVESPNADNPLQMVRPADDHQFPADILNKSSKENQETLLKQETKTSEEQVLSDLSDSDKQPSKPHPVLVESTQPNTEVEQQIYTDTIDNILSENIVQDVSVVLDDLENTEIHEDVLIDCGFWDFAGQREYYPTHPIFLNPNALHLVVSNITKDIKSIKAESFDQIGEYLEFWFDSVHSLRDFEPEEGNTQNNLNPPVILVCTHSDQYKDNTELEKRTDAFREQVLEMLGAEKKKHLRHIFPVSNKDSTDDNFDALREVIFKYGKEMETFGEQLPLKYIRLERALDIVRETGANILSWVDVTTLAYEFSFYNEYEINSFLKYQHKIGNIIYFEKLKETIILNQRWLAEAFKCLISVRFDEAVKMTDDWRKLEATGQLAENLIAELFKKESTLEFNKRRHHILKVMEIFGIIFKLTTWTADGGRQTLPTYYMPSMISQKSTIEDIQKEFDGCTQSPWLCVEFDFMPLDVFNNIMCEFISRYSVCKVPDAERMALYHGLGVFDLNNTELQKLVVYFCKDTIALQIWQWEPVDKGKYKELVELLRSWISRYQTKFERRKLKYTEKIKCSDGNIHKPSGKQTYKKLSNEEKYMCKHDKKNILHWSKDFLETWFYSYSEPPNQEVLLPSINDSVELKSLCSDGTYEWYLNQIYLVGACNVGKSTLGSLLIGIDTPLTLKATNLGKLFGRNEIDRKRKKMVSTEKGKEDPDVFTNLSHRWQDKDKYIGDIKQELIKRQRKAGTAPCDIVEVGGQTLYDLLHPLVIRGKGTYTLMFDGRKGLQEPLSEYTEADVTTEAILHCWVDFILTYCVDDVDDILPVILFVATHRDCLTQHEELKRMTEFKQRLEEMFQNHDQSYRIKYKDVFFINARDQSEINALKTAYVEIAFKQRSWGKRMPMGWVSLELRMSEMRAQNKSIISKDDVIKVNKEHGDFELTDRQLDEFLRVYHSLGQIVYFPGQKYIILQPTILADIIRSFMTDNKFWPTDSNLRRILQAMTETGIIRKEGLFTLWSHGAFNLHMPDKDVRMSIAQILTCLGILVEPKRNRERESAGDFYIVPSVVKREQNWDFDETIDQDKMICLTYHLTKSSISSALFFQLIGAALNVWPLKETDKGWCFYHKAAVLCIDKENELYLAVKNERVMVYLVNEISKHFISPDIASFAQEVLTKALINAIQFSHNTVASKSKTDLFKMEVGNKCDMDICYVSIPDAKNQQSWKCKYGKEHKTRYPLYWIYDKKQRECNDDCAGIDKEILALCPEDKHLPRLSKNIEIRTFHRFVVNGLGISNEEWEMIEYKHLGANALNMKIEALITWKLKTQNPSFQDLYNAVTGTDHNIHKFCQIFREDTIVLEIDDLILQEVPDNDTLKELSRQIGNCALHLGSELGLEYNEVEETINRYRKDIFAQNYDILMKWKKSNNGNKTMRYLMHVLHIVDRRGCFFLEKRYNIET